MLLGGGSPLSLSARITGKHGSSSAVSSEPASAAVTKIAARYLGPYLKSRDLAASLAASPAPSQN